MRSYQRKQVEQLAKYYQSNDPLRWVFIGLKIAPDRIPSRREQKLFSRRVVRTIEQTTEQVMAGMAAFAAAVTQMGSSFKTFADNIKEAQS